LFGLMGFGVFWGIREELYADPGLIVDQIVVTPEEALPQEKVQELEKLFLGHNILKIPLRKAAQKIEGDAGIRRARVIRDFPRTLRIEVTLRRTFAQVRLHSKGPLYRTGEDGVLLSTDVNRDGDLLLIEAFESNGEHPAIGQRLRLTGFREATELLRAFWGHPLGKAEVVDRVRLDHLGNVSVALRNGPELRFGRRPLEKIHALDTVAPLLKGPERQRIVYIELQYQDLIVKKK